MSVFTILPASVLNCAYAESSVVGGIEVVLQAAFAIIGLDVTVVEPPFAGFDFAVNFISLREGMQNLFLKLFLVNTTTVPRHVKFQVVLHQVFPQHRFNSQPEGIHHLHTNQRKIQPCPQEAGSSTSLRTVRTLRIKTQHSILPRQNNSEPVVGSFPCSARGTACLIKFCSVWFWQMGNMNLDDLIKLRRSIDDDEAMPEFPGRVLLQHVALRTTPLLGALGMLAGAPLALRARSLRLLATSMAGAVLMGPFLGAFFVHQALADPEKSIDEDGIKDRAFRLVHNLPQVEMDRNAMIAGFAGAALATVASPASVPMLVRPLFGAALGFEASFGWMIFEMKQQKQAEGEKELRSMN